MQILKEMAILPTQVAVAVVVILPVAADQVVLVAAVMVVIDQAVQVTQEQLIQDQAAVAAVLMAEDQEAAAELEECSSEYLQPIQ